ncbi:MAG: DUF4290 domain-containing protein [Dysgonamonadaceae bacterium]|jgi:hypothetical protein|nr:DUF4290 domain-containing protein [Dysgonamonadaceae bacterium]
MNYNTKERVLALPEYGRNIQNMIDHCVSIEDRKERTRCADTIINIMGNMCPYLRDVNDFKHILWDHLALMSNYALDIDYPYAVKKNDPTAKPPKLPYPQTKIRYKHYGKILEDMIRKASNLEDSRKKHEIVGAIANYMKKSFLLWNKETVDDRKIYEDLKELSNGKIIIDETSHRLTDSKDILLRNNRNTAKKQRK